MLLNVPDYKTLNESALSHHFFAWEHIMKIASIFSEVGFDENEDQTEWEDYLAASQRDLNVYYNVIQQSNELALKARICKVSPYLLLAGVENRFKSKTMDIEFSTLRTISAVDLISSVNSLTRTPISNEFQTVFNNLRVRRNSKIHLDVSNGTLNPIEMLGLLTSIYTELWPDRVWLSDRVEFGSHSADAYFADGSNFSILGTVLTEWRDTCEFVNKGSYKKLFGIQKTKRRYICFDCLDEATTDYQDDWDYESISIAHLQTKNILKCLLCESQFRVVRRACPRTGECMGDVISHQSESHSGKCHTCSYHPAEI